MTEQDTVAPQSPGYQRTLLFVPSGWRCLVPSTLINKMEAVDNTNMTLAMKRRRGEHSQGGCATGADPAG